MYISQRYNDWNDSLGFIQDSERALLKDCVLYFQPTGRKERDKRSTNLADAYTEFECVVKKHKEFYPGDKYKQYKGSHWFDKCST